MLLKKLSQFIVLSLFIFVGFEVQSQEFTQSIQGKIIDTDTKSPIPFAKVIVIDSEPLLAVISDVDGHFTIKNVPLGRASLKVSFSGYDDKIIPNLVVISGKVTVIDVELKESFKTMEEMTVSAKKNKSDGANEMAQVSSRSLSVEESKRYAGGIGDPARLVSSFAGVGSTGEGNNDIIVRGNNPRFIQWKLEGTEIPNPNHFSQEGLTGGPISALNSQMLANSEFYTGAFAPEYGNALSGIFDMKLRNGNHQKRENSFTVSVLGTDFTTEGPFKKGGKSSYLVNYRYSTLNLISKLGILDFGGIPDYQDLSFKVILPTKKAGTFSLFGLGGLNKIKTQFYDLENTELVNEAFQQKGLLGIVGVKHLINLNEKAYISTTLSNSVNGNESTSMRTFNSSSLQNDLRYFTNNSIIRLNSRFNYKLNKKHLFQVGFVSSFFQFNFESSYFNSSSQQFINQLDIDGNANLSQSFITWKWRATEKLSLVTGIHSQNTSQNREITFEPRASLRYDLPKGQAITAGFGVHSNMTSLSNYYALVTDNQGNSFAANKNLELLKARHYVLGYENKLAKNLFFKVEGYFQALYNIPIEIGNSSYSLINQRTEFSNRILVNEGKGRNIGLELTLEKYFSNNYYFLVTTSLFDSKYKSSDNQWRNTRFNGNFIANGLVGKEFFVGKSKQNVLGLNSKIAWMGANRLQKIDLEKSISAGYAVYDEQNTYQEKGENIFSLNVAVSYRINKSKLSHEFKIDVQNVTNHAAVIDYYYNDVNKNIETFTQLSLLPILSYTLNF